MAKVKRRDLLKAGAALAAAGTLGKGFAQEFYASPPTLLPRSRAPRVVVVGGGWGGTTVARKVKQQNPGVEVVLVEQKPIFMSCPMSNLFLAGVKPLEWLVFDYTNVVKDGVIFVQEKVLEINRDRRLVRTTGGYLAYDFLVLAPGIDYMYEAIPGYEEAKHFLPVGFKPFEHIALRRMLDRFDETGGELVMYIPPPPYRCPPGPYERAAMLAWRLKTKGVKGKVIVLDANPQPLAKAPGFLAAYNELYKDYLEYHPNMRITGLDYERKVVRTELGDYPFTLANVIPPMKAAEIVRQAGLGERWANVRIPYFLSEADDRVYLVGDITGNTPYPKSGMIAYVSGTIVARHLTERLKGKPLAEIPPELPTNICYSFVDSEEAIWVSANYSWDEAEKRIKAQSQVDNQRSKANGEAAIGWALGLWNDMFGPA
ncbi:sulfide dehydrogenase [Thermus thermophilus]|uniref:FAD-dependent oxidoreductase n=1 Tax=Thermus thermophilus TaxID=274 RepID=UPI001FCB4FDC|nr:FAD-dependent oxidoreductase [Thermus thermophilus]BDG19605.1 sulfide dehydrogenase [Thermus thermophilus]BDG21803.1 sulfide dehydrogenase [Thermus thermophilus]BDG24355.1 sulfide dehydrogenase [Thermus thermophilus]BDG25978.1 sulfide dehydrogenase [Thermus thermophilus]BDG28405.1 sulfide dehydrogenase [Thermus thermophilus]